MQKILVSACLLGEPVRFHGGDSRLTDATLQHWIEEGRVVPLCPEVAGGLPTPRPAAEIVQSPDGPRVLTASGRDVTAAFNAGAHEAVRLCREHGIRIAILKESSPSCGGQQVYDGTFSGRRIRGQGVTAGKLTEIGVHVFNETEIARAAAVLHDLERSP